MLLSIQFVLLCFPSRVVKLRQTMLFVDLDVQEKLPQGELACGSQAFIATLLFSPVCSQKTQFPSFIMLSVKSW